MDTAGKVVLQFHFPHTADGWSSLREKLSGYPSLRMAIETSQGLVVTQLVTLGLLVFPVNPASASRYRERQYPSGTKDDVRDAWALANALRTDGADWTPLAFDDPLTEELRLLCRDEVGLIGQRTALVNQLQAALLEYFPALLEAFDDWTVPAAWKFIQTFPTPQKLAAAGRRKWENFLHANRMWRPELGPKRLAIFARASQLCGSTAQINAKSRLALSLVAQLQTVHRLLADYRRQIELLFDRHPDRAIFDSLPGAGPKLAPRLLAEMGDDRVRFPSADRLQCVAGTAPVRYQSGQSDRTRMRRSCSGSLRTAVHHWCDQSRHYCAWAQAYYRQHRDKGQSHACALRCLGQRWLKILWRMWQNSTPYDETLHTRNQTQHGSWVLHLKPV